MAKGTWEKPKSGFFLLRAYVNPFSLKVAFLRLTKAHRTRERVLAPNYNPRCPSWFFV